MEAAFEPPHFRPPDRLLPDLKFRDHPHEQMCPSLRKTIMSYNNEPGTPVALGIQENSGIYESHVISVIPENLPPPSLATATAIVKKGPLLEKESRNLHPFERILSRAIDLYLSPLNNSFNSVNANATENESGLKERGSKFNQTEVVHRSHLPSL